MKDRIEIEDYVRTREGYLGKLIAINEQDYNYLVVDTTRKIRNDGFPATYLYLKNEDIVKHSKNIINLIEIGDVIEIYFPIKQIAEKVFADEYFKDSLILDGIIQKRIILKKILIKEQFLQNSYEVEG